MSPLGVWSDDDEFTPAFTTKRALRRKYEAVLQYSGEVSNQNRNLLEQVRQGLVSRGDLLADLSAILIKYNEAMADVESLGAAVDAAGAVMRHATTHIQTLQGKLDAIASMHLNEDGKCRRCNQKSPCPTRRVLDGG